MSDIETNSCEQSSPSETFIPSSESFIPSSSESFIPSSSESPSPVEKRIIVLRHADSEFVDNGSNERNSKLTEQGRNSCPCLNFDVDLVICSSLRRARETLDNSNIVYKDVIFTDICREYLDESSVNYYNGEEIRLESEEDLERRVDEFREMVNELMNTCDSICIITHYVFLKKMTGFSFNNCNFMSYSPGDL
jgi:phosphohistidine phosphatase SixA